MYGTARYLAPEVYIRVCVCVCVYVCVYVCVCRYIQPYILFLSGAQWGKDGATVGHLGSWVCSSGNVHQPLSVCGSVFQRHYAHATNPWPQKVQVLKSPLYYDLYRHYIRALTGTILGHWLLRFFFFGKAPRMCQRRCQQRHGPSLRSVFVLTRQTAPQRIAFSSILSFKNTKNPVQNLIRLDPASQVRGPTLRRCMRW
jgi:hypothetical protein